MSDRGARISACIIARDEESFIGSCLASLEGAVDEVVVVDTGSCDRTVEIARAAGARVIQRPWPGDFSLARNWSLEEATGDWALVIDADERLVPGGGRIVRGLVASGSADGYLVNIHHFLDDEENHLVSQRVGLFRRDPRFRYVGRIHEQLPGALWEGGARLSPSRIELVHDGYEAWVRQAKRKHERNLALLLDEVQSEPMEARWHYYVGQEYQALGRVDEAATAFERALDLVRPGSSLVIPIVLRLLLAYARLGRWEEFFALSDRYRSAYPSCTDIAFIDARVSLALGNPRRALQMLLEAIGRGEPAPGLFQVAFPGTGSYRAWFVVGQVLEHMGQKPEAVAAYLNALQIRPTFRSSAAALVRLLLTSDLPENVMSFMLEHVASRDPATLVTLSEAFLRGGAPTQALVVLDQIDDSASEERALRQGIVYAALGDGDAARSSLEASLRTDAIRDRPALDGAVAALDVGATDLADAFVSRLHRARFAMPIVVLRRLLDRHREFTGVEVRVDDDLDVARNPADRIGAAWDLVARVLSLGLYRAGERLVDDILRHGVPREKVEVTLAHLVFGLGRKAYAAELLLRAAQRGATLDARSAAILAQAALEQGDNEGAEALLRHAASQDSRDHHVAAALASLLAERGKRDEAVRFLEERIAANPWAARLREQRDRLLAAALSDGKHG